jgi:hydrogenase expression/formation protein HypD
LEKEKFKGATIEMVYSIREAIGLSERHPDKKVVFLAIGFETTTPPTAAGVIEAKNKGLKNFFVLVSHKVMPPAMKAIIDDEINVDAFLAPGHVSVITGSSIYDFISRDYKKPVVISGFEPLDIMQSIYEIVRQSEENKAEVHIQYSRVVKPEGNTIAQTITDEVFEPTDANWRGLGILKNSALKFNEAFSSFDAEQAFQLSVETPDEPKGCMCGYILKGLNNPNQCPLFARTCTPDNPVGACMVSPEGACNVYYRYDR